MSEIQLHTVPLALSYDGLSKMARMPPSASPCTYVIGDLHGNALKLLAFLLYVGLIEFGNIFEVFCMAYYGDQRWQSPPKNYPLFQSLLPNVKFNQETAKNIKLIFLGDTLCDRGNSDYMTLLLYELMAKNNVNFTIIVSNHDLGFIRQMECYSQYYYFPEFEVAPYDSYDINNENRSHAIEIYQNIYKPRLKAVDLDYADGKTIIYSHAPCNFQAIQSLSCNYSQRNGNIIDNVNFINSNLAPLIRAYCNNPTAGNPLFDFVWERNTNKRFPDNYMNVFGHIGERDKYRREHNLAKNQINLDTNLGRHEEYLSPNQPSPAKCTNGNLKILQVAPVAATKDETTQNLVDKIKSAVLSYVNWFNQRSSKNWFSCRSTIGWFHQHGDDGQRRANEFLRQANLAKNPGEIWNLLRSFANNQIRQDEMNRAIGGKVQAHPHSFISYLLNELKTDENLWQQLFPQARPKSYKLANIDFTQDNQMTNVVRTKILANLKNIKASY